MKKISDKSFWIILVISVVTLASLVIGVILLTKENKKEFYSAGYIINSNQASTTKLYFNNNTTYKENIKEEYVFKNTDNEEVTASKDNFIHYLDKSLSFMKKGVILDLDKFNKNLVPYYNITDKSIIKYNNGSYNIESADKTLIFNNFLGRITENKYIIVGNDIRIKLAGSDNTVTGDYFEILFVEDGIVKVENQEGSYQTIADGTIVFIGDTTKINLGDKNVIYNDETKLSLSEMTIDGNENIDIKPSEGKVDKKEDKDKTNNGEATEGTGTGTGTGTGGGDAAGPGTDSGNDANTPSGSTDGGTNPSEGDNTVSAVLKKEVSVDLITAKVDANSLNASFQVIDTGNFIKGDLLLTLTNMTTNKTEYTKLLANAPDIQSINVSSLSPDCNYLLTITDENSASKVQYFQKTFKTDSLSLNLIREVVTQTSLTYSLDFENYTDIKSANISLYDTEGNKVGTTTTINNGEDNSVTFEELNHNTKYEVRVDSVILKNTNYADVYTISTQDLTLKNKPTIGEISVEVDSDGQNFTLKMTKPTDEDSSITKYTYQIYKAADIIEDDETTASPIYTFTSDTLKDQKLALGENNLEGKTDYRYKVIVEYYDNYKYNEIETSLSDYFQVLGKPTIEFTEELVDFNQIVGTVKIKDEGCTVPNEGRECFNQKNNFIIRYDGESVVGKPAIKGVTFDPVTMEYKLSLTGLKQNTLYTFTVSADVDMRDGQGLEEGKYIGSFQVRTKGIEALQMQNWKQKEYSFATPIKVSTEMVSTVEESDYANKISSITFNLYKGDTKNNIQTVPLKTITETEDIKSKYYNKEFFLTSNMFGIESLDELRDLSGGKLSRYYTLEVTDAYDATGTNKFQIIDNKFVFETPAMLLLEDEVEEPTIAVTEILNETLKDEEAKNKYGKTYDNNLDAKTIRGYEVTAIFEKSKIETYFQGEHPITKLNFYAINQNNKEIEKQTIDFTQEENYTAYFFLDYGTDYNTVDDKLARGNSYNFSYDLSIDSNNDGKDDSTFPSNRPTSDKFISVKKDPIFKMYVDTSSKNNITYKYTIKDIDNALYKDKEEDIYKFYYQIEDSEEEHTVEIEKANDMKTFTISNLNNGNIYSLSYMRASTKTTKPSKINLGKYYFDGYYDANDYNIGYKLEYTNFDNRLKIVLNNDDFLDRISTYLLTLTTQEDKYEKVISTLSTCEENKCIIIDYNDIESFKGKNIEVSLVGFYDTGYTGFSQKTLLGNYFKSLAVVEEKDAAKLGYVFQTTPTEVKGQYISLNPNGSYAVNNLPVGIFGYEVKEDKSQNDLWYITSTDIVNKNQNTFYKYGEFKKSDGITNLGAKGFADKNTKYTLNPKVLDKVNIETDNNTFKFTSITPKVSTSNIEPLINGATMNIYVSASESILESDFVKTEGKYKFYIDIYTKKTCEAEEEECTEEYLPFKTIETDYESLKNEITFEGLDPDTRYFYKISADMNKNGEKVKTPLFDYEKEGYIEYLATFKTLGKDDILNRVAYNYDSTTTTDKYLNRTINLITHLKNNKNFDIKYEMRDLEGTLILDGSVTNEAINDENIGKGKKATYTEDITDKNLIYGSDYYTLTVYAVTTDNQKELKLFEELMSDKNITAGQNYHELKEPSFTIKQEAIINKENDAFTYGLKYIITLEDKDKVIKDGLLYVELEDGDYNHVCPSGNEDNCKKTINLANYGSNQIELTYTNLKPDTNYVIYAYVDIYRNNISLTEEEKTSKVEARKSQYTKSELGFSLGAVTPTALSKNKVLITFKGATNLQEYIKGIEYSMTVEGLDKVGSGLLGQSTTSTGSNLVFKLDKDAYPTIEVSTDENKILGLNNNIKLIYYYEDKDGKIKALKIGDSTSDTKTFKYEGK